MSEDFADETLKTVTNWGRYAEIFTYHEDDDQFSLDDPQCQPSPLGGPAPAAGIRHRRLMPRRKPGEDWVRAAGCWPAACSAGARGGRPPRPRSVDQNRISRSARRTAQALIFAEVGRAGQLVADVDLGHAGRAGG
jgi:hypothetical protein